MGKRFDLISDPIRTAQSVSVYVVGDQWREAPYEESIYSGAVAAVLVRGVNQALPIGRATRIYAKGGNEAGDGRTTYKTFTRVVSATNSSRYSRVEERVKW